MTALDIPWQLVMDLTLIVVLAVPLLALAGLPLLALVGQNLAHTRQRSAYAKCARQLALLATGLGWLLCLGGAALFWTRVSATLAEIKSYSADAQSLDWIGAIQGSVFLQADILLWVTLLGAAVLLTLYYAGWNTLRERESLHQCLGLVGAFWACLALYGLCCVIAAGVDPELHFLKDSSDLKKIFMPGFDSAFWNSGPYLPALVISMAAGMGAVWLIVRRTRDDYGRDYYALMLPWCAVWARNAWFVLWLVLVLVTGMQWWPLLQGGDFLNAPEFIDNSVFLLLWTIPGLLWTLATKSKTPLRHKLTLVLAFLLSLGIVIPMYMGLIAESY